MAAPSMLATTPTPVATRLRAAAAVAGTAVPPMVTGREALLGAARRRPTYGAEATRWARLDAADVTETLRAAGTGQEQLMCGSGAGGRRCAHDSNGRRWGWSRCRLAVSVAENGHARLH